MPTATATPPLACSDKRGTTTGSGRHYRAHEPQCEECRQARNQYGRDRLEIQRELAVPRRHLATISFDGLMALWLAAPTDVREAVEPEIRTPAAKLALRQLVRR